MWASGTRTWVILEEEFQAVSDKFVMMTDDGSYGEKGLVTNALEKLIGEARPTTRSSPSAPW